MDSKNQSDVESQKRIDDTAVLDAVQNGPNESSSKLEQQPTTEKIRRVRKHQRRRELRKIFKEDSNWSLPKVIITALAAVSVAVISSRLTSVVNSVLLVAILSVLSAFISEIYRIIMALGSLGAKKAVEILPIDLKKENFGSKVESDPGVEELHVSDPKTEALETISRAVRIPEDEKGRHGFWSWIRRYFKANSFARFIALFLVISLVTVGVSAFVSSRVEKVENNYTTVKKSEVVQLTKDEKDQMIQEAVNKALEKYKQDSGAKTTEVDGKLIELGKNLDLLKNDKTKNQQPAIPTPNVSSNAENVKKLEAEINDLRKQLSDSETKRTAQEKQLTDLSKRLEQLEKGNSPIA